MGSLRYRSAFSIFSAQENNYTALREIYTPLRKSHVLQRKKVSHSVLSTSVEPFLSQKALRFFGCLTQNTYICLLQTTNSEIKSHKRCGETYRVEIPTHSQNHTTI